MTWVYKGNQLTLATHPTEMICAVLDM